MNIFSDQLILKIHNVIFFLVLSSHSFELTKVVFLSQLCSFLILSDVLFELNLEMFIHFKTVVDLSG